MRSDRRRAPRAGRRPCSTRCATAGRSPPADVEIALDARRAAQQGRLGLELVGGQAGARVPVLGRRGHARPGAPRSSSAATPSPSGCCRRPCVDAPDADRRGGVHRADAGSRPARTASASEQCLRDYFRLRSGGRAGRDRRAGRRRASCCRSEVEGWRAAGLPAPRRAAAPARCGPGRCSSPFDPLVWERDRAEALFGFRYRIEIYVPARQAGARLLRAAVPARRPAGRPGRPQGRPRRGCAAGAVGVGRGAGARARPRRSWPPSCASSRPGSVSTTRRDRPRRPGTRPARRAALARRPLGQGSGSLATPAVHPQLDVLDPASPVIAAHRAAGRRPRRPVARRGAAAGSGRCPRW